MANDDGAAGQTKRRKPSQLAVSWRDGAARAARASDTGEVERSSRAKLTLKFGAIAGPNSDT